MSPYLTDIVAAAHRADLVHEAEQYRRVRAVRAESRPPTGQWWRLPHTRRLVGAHQAG